ncbi:hypothetical protein K438DRAFT_1966025 [Mycena galopus ATCC 62051]|nr:hypothetical protein K438DRAFT_1966025 [Mycena galopus ATCC 62051]
MRGDPASAALRDCQIWSLRIPRSNFRGLRFRPSEVPASTFRPAIELEVYTSGTNNVHLSGDGQLYIVPTLSGGTWYSGRLESITSDACDSGGAMVFQAELWLPDFNGSPAEFAGLWPAFWALGEDKRSSGVPWPTCGDGGVAYAGGQYHTWAFKVDRRNSDWTEQALTWYLDGTAFYSVTGAPRGADARPTRAIYKTD